MDNVWNGRWTSNVLKCRLYLKVRHDEDKPLSVIAPKRMTFPTRSCEDRSLTICFKIGKMDDFLRRLSVKNFQFLLHSCSA